VLALALVSGAAPGEELAGRVTEVTSGDTLRLDTGVGSVQVRLSDIGAPQGGDYYAPASRQLLANITTAPVVRVAVVGRAGPDRIFGRVRVGELDANLELVKRGAAWVCLEYATDTSLLPYERTAQRLQLGLWGATWSVDAWAACRARPPAATAATARLRRERRRRQRMVGRRYAVQRELFG
jgi:endonuclease YncB( thermonuclease family)